MPLKAIPIIDVFAGPGGLSEGFSRFSEFTGGSISFQTRLAIEKDPVAAETLTLRSFFRQFDHRSVPDEYYKVIRQQLPVSSLERFPEWDTAKSKVWNVELGAIEERDLHAHQRRAVWCTRLGPPRRAALPSLFADGTVANDGNWGGGSRSQ